MSLKIQISKTTSFVKKGKVDLQFCCHYIKYISYISSAKRIWVIYTSPTIGTDVEKLKRLRLFPKFGRFSSGKYPRGLLVTVYV